MNKTHVQVISGPHAERKGFADVYATRNGRVLVHFEGVNLSGAYIKTTNLMAVK